MRKTRNIRQAQEFLGHSSIVTTQIYALATKGELRVTTLSNMTNVFSDKQLFLE